MNLVESFEEIYETRLPTHKAVCPRCNGNGSHDAWEGGMTSEEVYEQGEDFLDDYLNGMYSVTCSKCEGRNVVPEVDMDAISPAVLAQWLSYQQEYWETEDISRMERMMGA